MPQIPIILDCDPGHDDALAMALALARPELAVLGITTVAGNAPLTATTRNALRVLALLDRTDIPVAVGADRPLVGDLVTSPEFHGPSGLDGADLPEPRHEPVPESALAFLAETIERASSPIVLVPTGPLTNVATLLLSRPDLAGRIERICLMGGAIREGNQTASAEFNIWVDPEAARIVFQSGIPIAMMGLDVTHQALFTEPDIDRLVGIGTRVGAVFADLLRFFAIFHRARYGWAGAPIHDAVAVAYLVVPGLVTTERRHVDVETAGLLTRGRTVVDTRGAADGLPPTTDVGVAIDRERFADLLVTAIASYR